jgi:hypothetical protein
MTAQWAKISVLDWVTVNAFLSIFSVVSDSELNGPLSDTEQGGEGTAFRYLSAAATAEEVENAAIAAQSAGEPRTPQVIRAQRPCMSVFFR